MSGQRRAFRAPVFAALAWVALASGCGDAGEEYCDVVCECFDCNETEREVCLVDYDRRAEVASVYECEQEFSDYDECIIAKADCPSEGMFVDTDCDDALAELEECRAATSSLDR